MEDILDGLPQPIKKKTRQCILAKDLWVKLEKLYSVEQRAEEILDIFENYSDDVEPCSHMEDSEDEENLSMDTVTSEDEPDVEGEMDLKEELISSLDELRKSRVKNKYLK